MTGRPEVVVLDLDKTLVKLDVDWQGLRERLAALARDAGVETRDPGIKALMDGARLPGMEQLRTDMEEVLTAAEVAGASGPRNEALLAWLEAMPHTPPVSVLSLNSRLAVLAALDRHGLAERVTHVVGREDVKRGKPDPEGMLELARRHRIDPAAMVLVGDAETDRLCAERAGAGFVHVEEIGIRWHTP